MTTIIILIITIIITTQDRIFMEGLGALKELYKRSEMMKSEFESQGKDNLLIAEHLQDIHVTIDKIFEVNNELIETMKLINNKKLPLPVTSVHKTSLPSLTKSHLMFNPFSEQTRPFFGGSSKSRRRVRKCLLVMLIMVMFVWWVVVSLVINYIYLRVIIILI